jgi:hypothetical protein
MTESQQKQQYYDFANPQEQLIKSLIDLKFLSRLTTSNSYKRIEFFAQDICNLPTYLERVERTRGRPNLSYEEAVQCATDIGKQLFHMEKQNQSWLFLNKEKVFVINNHHFIYLGEDTKETKKTNNSLCEHITITTPPFTKREVTNNNIIIAPELVSLSTLPYNINSRCVYYSLGSLVSSCLHSLEEIRDTKLYWFLMRCMKTSPSERSLIFF